MILGTDQLFLWRARACTRVASSARNLARLLVRVVLARARKQPRRSPKSNIPLLPPPGGRETAGSLLYRFLLPVLSPVSDARRSVRMQSSTVMGLAPGAARGY